MKQTENIYKNDSSLSGKYQGEVDSNKSEISGDSNCGEFCSKKLKEGPWILVKLRSRELFTFSRLESFLCDLNRKVDCERMQEIS